MSDTATQPFSTVNGRAKLEDLIPGTLVRAVYTHLTPASTNRVMRVLRTPRRQPLTRGSDYAPLWVTVEDVDGPAAGIRHDISLGDFNYEPYPNGKWNGTNYLQLVEAA